MPYSKIELYAAIRRDAPAGITARAIERKHGQAWPRRASRGIPSPGSGGRKATIRVPPGGKLPSEADWRLARRQSAPRGRAHVPVVLACLLRYYADLPVFSLVRVRRCSGLAR
jgi:hypothetical protein